MPAATALATSSANSTLAVAAAFAVTHAATAPAASIPAVTVTSPPAVFSAQ